MQNAADFLEELQELNDNRSSESRRQLLHKVTDLFLVTTDNQSEDNNVTFGEIMGRLAFQLEQEVRAELSERLADSEHTPPNLVNRLAHDHFEVARPILERSPIIKEEVLVDIARTKGKEHLLAISGRKSLNPHLTDIIIERGCTEVLHKVASNEGANFSRQGFEKLASEATQNYELNATLSLRKDTPADLLKEIKLQVATKLKSEMHDREIDIQDSEIDKVVELKSLSVEIENEETLAAFKKIDELHRMRQLDERIINHFVSSDRLVETIYALSLLSKLDRNIVKHCLLEAEVPALAVLCKSSGFDRNTFSALLKLRENDPAQTIDNLAAVKKYETLDLATAQRVMRFLNVRNGAEKAQSATS